jgi:hypothetical protein
MIALLIKAMPVVKIVVLLCAGVLYWHLYKIYRRGFFAEFEARYNLNRYSKKRKLDAYQFFILEVFTTWMAAIVATSFGLYLIINF